MYAKKKKGRSYLPPEAPIKVNEVKTNSFNGYFNTENINIVGLDVRIFFKAHGSNDYLLYVLFLEKDGLESLFKFWENSTMEKSLTCGISFQAFLQFFVDKEKFSANYGLYSLWFEKNQDEIVEFLKAANLLLKQSEQNSVLKSDVSDLLIGRSNYFIHLISQISTKQD